MRKLTLDAIGVIGAGCGAVAALSNARAVEKGRSVPLHTADGAKKAGVGSECCINDGAVLDGTAADLIAPKHGAAQAFGLVRKSSMLTVEDDQIRRPLVRRNWHSRH